MCGIFGWLGHEPLASPHLANIIGQVLNHRGPDDNGFNEGANWGLGFRRLSILDLSPLGHQPMQSPDGRYWISFNGEIYNYLELKQSLEKMGERFVSSSDTEVLLRVLQLYGADGLSKLNGMFALAFIDTQEETFLLARDRLGQKPLFYLKHQGSLRFASELKALLAWPDAPKTLNRTALVEYLAMTYISGDSCIFEGYEKLPPAHFIQGSLSEPHAARTFKYWDVELNDEAGNDQLSTHQIDELENLLKNAIDIRLRSDVPVGIFLSGGLDSGLVASLAGQKNLANPPLALTVSFDNSAYDESGIAAEIADHSNLPHEVIHQSAVGLADIDQLAAVYDEPFGDSSALPTLAICQAARKMGTVFLTGDGGDEAFGGYSRYIKAQKYQWLKHMPQAANWGIKKAIHSLPLLSPLKFQFSKMALSDMGYAAAFDETPADPVLAQVLNHNDQSLMAESVTPLWLRWALTNSGTNLLQRQQSLDYSLYLPDDVLVKMDRASMAHSIEVRSPFLDHRLVEWSAALPRATLMNSAQGKLPLRLLGQRHLPSSATNAKKQGFSAPVGHWFSKKEGQNLLKERLLSPEALERKMWNEKTVAAMIEKQKTIGQGRDLGTWLWRLLVLDSWARHYYDSPPPPPLAQINLGSNVSNEPTQNITC